MPGSRNKRKGKAAVNAKARRGAKETADDAQASSFPCLTLEEDEITRCGQPATEGYPRPERCKVHHGQYRILYEKYKDASKVVDNTKGGAELPTKEQIDRYKDWHAALKKARWVRTYLEAIRVEKTGREIHQRRFFLKVDDGHRRRLKLLEREMVKAVNVLDAFQRKAYELYQLDGGILPPTNHQALSEAEVELEKKSKRTTEELLDSVRDPNAFRDSTLPFAKRGASTVLPTPAVGDEDLIDMSLRVRKEQMITIMKMLIDVETFTEVFVEENNHRPETESGRAMMKTYFFIYQQFARRIIFHQPTLFMKSLGKVSFSDLILSDDFSMEDLVRFLDLFLKPMDFPLKWFKDAVLDAVAISRYGTAANVGSVENRFPLLGGWVFNRAHTVRMSNEAWWFLLKVLQPQGNIENLFVRLCNNFDDLVGFLSLEALGMVPSPNFCSDPPHPGFDDPRLSRNHLSLAGVVVADLVETPRPPGFRGPIPTTRRAKKHNCIVWAEIETRTYMFGAVRNEPDEFTAAFLRELRARPDLFQVILRSETAPGRAVEMFGSGPANNEALPAMRYRHFEAPPSLTPLSAPPSTSDSTWEVAMSATDVLYASGKQMPLMGYLTILARELKGWFFRYKTFSVTYFVVLDTVPYREKWVLARNVAWAALRARGYAEGPYTLRKYAAATDRLFEKCARERLGWIPGDMDWSVTKMEDRLDEHGVA